MAAYRGDVIVFILEDEVGSKECAVANEALCGLGRVNRKDVSQDELLGLFHVHRAEIEAAALKKLRAGVYDTGTILVTSDDLKSA